MTKTTSRPDRAWTERPLARIGALVAGAILISALGGWTRRARANDAANAPAAALASGALDTIERELDDARGRLALQQLQLDRYAAITLASSRYQVPADLAGAIHDIAVAEGIDPAIAFELVKLESNFKPKARSNRDAIGFAQVRLATARQYEPGLTEQQLYDRDVNLRVGFRFLKDLLRTYRGNLELALLAYNRGPGAVNDILAQGGDPQNGYATQVLDGARRAR
ncbi:MAG: transglycosylase SLT domain-containing protein [Gemmatimonadales bacterium]|nr:transglycosylase SLT domain-containing protein [Gemmatimonadales bacterium]